MPLQEAINLLQGAIEASVYAAPNEPGLTLAELLEVGKRLGLKEGEIGDALSGVSRQHFGPVGRRLMLTTDKWQMSGNLVFGEEPDLRNAAAFDFVFGQLNDITRELGAAKAHLDRSILIHRAQTAAIPQHDIEVAIALMLLGGYLTEGGGLLHFSHRQGGEKPLPSATRNHAGVFPKPYRSRAMPHVEDVVRRRVDGRPKSGEPFAAFAEKLGELGYSQFRLWWDQTAKELERADSGSFPLSVLVLSAALVEGVLTFVVDHARKYDLGVFGSTDFTKEPRSWRIDDLVKGAHRGGDAAIFDEQAKLRAEGLIRTRQRIHAGRVLSEFPTGIPDFRPEEARDAKAVAEHVVRRVVDWLERYPPQQ